MSVSTVNGSLRGSFAVESGASSSRTSTRSRSVYGGEVEPSGPDQRGRCVGIVRRRARFRSPHVRDDPVPVPRHGVAQDAPQVILAGMSVWAGGEDLLVRRTSPRTASVRSRSADGTPSPVASSGSCSCFEPASPTTGSTRKKISRASVDALRRQHRVAPSCGRPIDAGAERFDRALNADRVNFELSSVLYAFIRQSVRETGTGTTGCPRRRALVEEDVFGRPSLGTLLTDAEKAEFRAIDPNNRANMVVWRMQSIVEHHRRLGNISEGGALTSTIWRDAWRRTSTWSASSARRCRFSTCTWSTSYSSSSSSPRHRFHHRVQMAQPRAVVHRRHRLLRRRGGGEEHRIPTLDQTVSRPLWRRVATLLGDPATAVERRGRDAALARRRRRRKAKRVATNVFDGEDTSDTDEEPVVRVTVAQAPTEENPRRRDDDDGDDSIVRRARSRGSRDSLARSTHGG